jgi:hypothetical protein
MRSPLTYLLPLWSFTLLYTPRQRKGMIPPWPSPLHRVWVRESWSWFVTSISDNSHCLLCLWLISMLLTNLLPFPFSQLFSPLLSGNSEKQREMPQVLEPGNRRCLAPQDLQVMATSVPSGLQDPFWPPPGPPEVDKSQCEKWPGRSPCGETGHKMQHIIKWTEMSMSKIFKIKRLDLS